MGVKYPAMSAQLVGSGKRLVEVVQDYDRREEDGEKNAVERSFFSREIFKRVTVDRCPATLLPDVDDVWSLKPEKPKVIEMFGKEVPEPRFSVNFGKAYSYSGAFHPERAVPNQIQPLMEYARNTFKAPFNSVLVNFYADGKQYIGRHSDDEKALDANYPIVAVTLGNARRTMRFTPKKPGDGPKCKFDVEVGSGTAVAMLPGCQRLLKHEVLPRRRCRERRVNLSFRVVV